MSTAPLHVSLDATAVPEQPVGAGRYVIELTRALARRGDVGLTIWCRRSDAPRWERLFEETTPPGALWRAVCPSAPDNRLARLAWEQIALPRLLEGSGAAVHHGPHYTMPRYSPIPVVVTIHDLTFFDHPEWHVRVKVPIFRRAIRRAARRASALVCVSNHTAQRLRARTTVEGRVFVVPHGVDHHLFHAVGIDTDDDAADAAADAAVLESLRVRRPYVLFLGTLEPRKAVPDLVRAFAMVARRHPDLTLVLAGRPGWGSEHVRRAIAASGVADRVLSTGYVADLAVPPLLRRAGVVVYPAEEEGFGLPALEALACGAPLVTTAGTVMAELAGDAAVLVPPRAAQALAEAIDDAIAVGPHAGERRASGLATAARYSWESSAEGHLAAYRWAIDVGEGRLVGDRRPIAGRRPAAGAGDPGETAGDR